MSEHHIAEEQFYSRYTWCLNPILSIEELFDHLMFADYELQAVDFYRYSGVDGMRLSANPRVTLPWRLGDYLTGKD